MKMVEPARRLHFIVHGALAGSAGPAAAAGPGRRSSGRRPAKKSAWPGSAASTVPRSASSPAASRATSSRRGAVVAGQVDDLELGVELLAEPAPLPLQLAPALRAEGLLQVGRLGAPPQRRALEALEGHRSGACARPAPRRRRRRPGLRPPSTRSRQSWRRSRGAAARREGPRLPRRPAPARPAACRAARTARGRARSPASAAGSGASARPGARASRPASSSPSRTTSNCSPVSPPSPRCSGSTYSGSKKGFGSRARAARSRQCACSRSASAVAAISSARTAPVCRLGLPPVAALD